MPNPTLKTIPASAILPSQICHLCKAHPNGSREHIVPKWLQIVGKFCLEDVVIGTGKEQHGQLAAKEHKERGKFTSQKDKNILCNACNNRLGCTVEQQAMRLLASLCESNLPTNATETVTHFSVEDGQKLADWCCLRALEFNINLKRQDIDQVSQDRFFHRLHAVMERRQELALGSETVEIAFSDDKNVAFFIGSTFVDDHGIGAAKTTGSKAFQWGMQINQLILVYRYLPDTQVTRRLGGIGFCVYPRKMPNAQGIITDQVPRLSSLDEAMRARIITR